MNKVLRIAMILASTMALLHSVNAANVGGMMDYGQDGSEQYYQIRCDDNTRGSVVVYLEEPKICAQPPQEAEKCDAHWSLQEASAYACK